MLPAVEYGVAALDQRYAIEAKNEGSRAGFDGLNLLSRRMTTSAALTPSSDAMFRITSPIPSPIKRAAGAVRPADRRIPDWQAMSAADAACRRPIRKTGATPQWLTRLPHRDVGGRLVGASRKPVYRRPI
jgi:hypothetical protein